MRKRKRQIALWTTLLSIALFVGLAGNGIFAQIGPEPTPTPTPAPTKSANDDITYPPELDTNLKKYQADEALVGDAIEYFNLALSGAETLEQREEFRDIFFSKLAPIIHERNKLKDELIAAAYPKFGDMTIAQQGEALESLLGDKSTLREADTTATSTALSELKAVDPTKLTGIPFVDPTEDLTTYTEVADNPAKLTQTTARNTYAGVTRAEEAILYRDCDAGHFAADYTHLFEHANTDDDNDGGGCAVYGYANVADTFFEIDAASGDYHELALYDHGSGYQYYLRECNDGSLAQSDNTSAGDMDQSLYYMTWTRAEGSPSTLTCTIYEDATRETVDDLLTINLTEDKDWQYIFAFSTHDSGGATDVDGYTQDIDLQEADPMVINISVDGKVLVRP